MNTVWQDLRYAVRRLAKSPGFTAAAVLTLAIGIGINTALFSNMDAVVLHPLAVPQLDRVVTVGEQEEPNPATICRWRSRTTRIGCVRATGSNRWRCGRKKARSPEQATRRTWRPR